MKQKNNYHRYYCFLCKKFHKLGDVFFHFHTEWINEEKAKQQIKDNIKAEKLHKKTFKY
ncbi:MAG: hypothetical protein ACFFG0_02930 [Candidatus Thorarchaeota archaeon]